MPREPNTTTTVRVSSRKAFCYKNPSLAACTSAGTHGQQGMNWVLGVKAQTEPRRRAPVLRPAETLALAEVSTREGDQHTQDHHEPEYSDFFFITTFPHNTLRSWRLQCAFGGLSQCLARHRAETRTAASHSFYNPVLLSGGRRKVRLKKTNHTKTPNL